MWELLDDALVEQAETVLEISDFGVEFVSISLCFVSGFGKEGFR